MRIEVVAYDPTWPIAFEAIKSELTQALRQVDVVAIEHVGGTAVPGLASKPVLDIDVVVDRGQVGAAVVAFEATGYRYRGELGVPDRHAFASPQSGPTRHVYVIVDGSLALRNHLGVRDVLRTDVELRSRYGMLKSELSQNEFDTADQYVAQKSELLQLILERAGISNDERSAISSINSPSDSQESS